MPVKALEWKNNCVEMIDQTRLPLELIYLKITDYQELGDAIRQLKVRGAPAIGIAAAYGILLGIQNFEDQDSNSEFFSELNKVANYLKSTRPTAVNLFWAIDRMLNTAEKYKNEPITLIKKYLRAEAQAIHQSDIETCRLIGKYGSALIKDGMNVLTHCNAGALATGGIGTALGVMYAAAEAGKKFHVYADETRPLLQGSRLTTWELMQAGIAVTLNCDNMAAFLMQQKKVDLVITGADRIASNGDAANKIGTYNLAVLAEKHEVPFYIAAPFSTFDFKIKTGAEIPVEERDQLEITNGFGKQTAPDGINVFNPAFDVTPYELITGFITEKGIIYPPYTENFKNKP
jgi:methylthioribose-1-phosphate isomerase